mmetsp:Transcript_4631/g.10909  ORF Transcript_4631/g.10909 Transcript_4631/m.10909 type:complete len:209 (+) Transcript_4631:854-1480(+)
MLRPLDRRLLRSHRLRSLRRLRPPLPRRPAALLAGGTGATRVRCTGFARCGISGLGLVCHRHERGGGSRRRLHLQRLGPRGLQLRRGARARGRPRAAQVRRLRRRHDPARGGRVHRIGAQGGRLHPARAPGGRLRTRRPCTGRREREGPPRARVLADGLSRGRLATGQGGIFERAPKSGARVRLGHRVHYGHHAGKYQGGEVHDGVLR